MEFNLRYPGQYFDAESKLHYNYFRSYSPGQGRYTQADPIGLEGGLNRFGYVEGNAVSRVDPLGLKWIYQQSTGNLYHQPTNPSSLVLVSAGGYAGHGIGVNNPSLDSIPNIGPIPQGTYTIGPQQTIVTGTGVVLQGAMKLIPNDGNWMYGRAGFLIHGGNMQSQTSSAGCVIQPRNIRDLIGKSNDKLLEVVP
jgi:RHS repeat-associated protein